MLQFDNLVFTLEWTYDPAVVVPFIRESPNEIQFLRHSR